MQTKRWLLQYGVAVGLAALFAAMLGQIPLFRETMVGKFRASNLVQFIGYGAALITILLGARQIAGDRSDAWKWLGPFRDLVVPAALLVVLPLAYQVALLALGPLLGAGGKRVYNWMFVLGIAGAGGWVIATWVTKCAPKFADAGTEHKEEKRAA
ncbi:MAG TPA: hypothetical protein VFN94_02590 [Nitrospiria bacterium]|nr:hypothetical protein [Nitrospiria bacterium]